MTLCKSNESAIQWFHIHERITFAAILNQSVYLSSARVSISPVVVPRLNRRIFSSRTTGLKELLYNIINGITKCNDDGFWDEIS